MAAAVTVIVALNRVSLIAPKVPPARRRQGRRASRHPTVRHRLLGFALVQELRHLAFESSLAALGSAAQGARPARAQWRREQADALLHMQSAHLEDLPPVMPAAAGNLNSHGGIAAGSIDDDDEYAVPDMLFSATLPQDENIEEEREHEHPAAQLEDKCPCRRPGWQFAIFRDRITKNYSDTQIYSGSR